MPLYARDLDKVVEIQRQAAGDDNDINSAGARAFVHYDQVWAKLSDVRPTRSMIVDAGGIMNMPRRSTLSIRYRTDITPDMQFVFGPRAMKIIDGPAVLDGNEFLEILVEDCSTAGVPA